LIFCNVYGDSDSNGNDNASDDESSFVLSKQWDNGSNKYAREFVSNKRNSRGEGNRGLIYNYEDGDGDGNGDCDCLREKGVGQWGGERGNGTMGLFLFIFFHFDGGEEDCFMLSYFVIFFVFPFSMQID
jgi:hypothetical protein